MDNDYEKERCKLCNKPNKSLTKVRSGSKTYKVCYDCEDNIYKT